MRRWIANKLARLARLIYPDSEELMAFYMDRAIEAIVHGQSTIRVGTIPPGTVFKEPSTPQRESSE